MKRVFALIAAVFMSALAFGYEVVENGWNDNNVYLFKTLEEIPEFFDEIAEKENVIVRSGDVDFDGLFSAETEIYRGIEKYWRDMKMLDEKQGISRPLLTLAEKMIDGGHPFGVVFNIWKIGTRFFGDPDFNKEACYVKLFKLEPVPEFLTVYDYYARCDYLIVEASQLVAEYVPMDLEEQLAEYSRKMYEQRKKDDEQALQRALEYFR